MRGNRPVQYPAIEIGLRARGLARERGATGTEIVDQTGAAIALLGRVTGLGRHVLTLRRCQRLAGEGVGERGHVVVDSAQACPVRREGAGEKRIVGEQGLLERRPLRLDAIEAIEIRRAGAGGQGQQQDGRDAADGKCTG